jgi:hypothetical protein
MAKYGRKLIAVYIIIGRVSGANAVSPNKARARMVLIHAKLQSTKRVLENATSWALHVAIIACVFKGSMDISDVRFLNVEARARGIT